MKLFRALRAMLGLVDLLGIAGVGILVLGLWRIWPPLALVSSGLGLVLVWVWREKPWRS